MTHALLYLGKPRLLFSMFLLRHFKGTQEILIREIFVILSWLAYTHA